MSWGRSRGPQRNREISWAGSIGLSLVLVACSATSSAPPAASPSPKAPPSAFFIPAPTGASQRAEASLPEAREEHAAAALDGRLYVIAGFDSAGRDTDSVFVYGDAWTRGPRLPVALDHPSAAVLGGRIYVAGGFSAGSASTRTFLLVSSRWEVTASMHHARGALALVALDGRLYALGGNAGSTNVAVAEVYDPNANAWSDLPPLPNPRNHLAGFAYRGMACVAGGRSPNTARVDCFDPRSGSWTHLPDLPLPTSGAGAAVVSDQVIVAGGEGSAIIDQLARYDGSEWHLDQMLVPRHGLQLAVLEGRAWACAGGTSPGLHATTVCTSIS